MTTILIVDSRPDDRQPYTTLLNSFGYRVLEAGDGSEALELARTELPDLVITDIIMPNMDGFTLARRLRAEPLLASVPVIFQTVHSLEAEVRKLATSSGIQHVLGKPAEPQQILHAVQDTLKQPTDVAKLPKTGELQREHLQLLADKLYEKNLELEKTNERLRNLSLTDELTGLNNRRGFMILANGLLKFSRRANHPLCLLYIDMDSLKKINDTFGHAHGDIALTHFAHILTQTFRDSDVIARMGGDEFAVLTIDATEGSLNAIKERLQSNVDTHNLESGRSYSLSFSLGIIRVDLTSTYTVDALLAQADAAMYEHKKQRKRKV
ncbi:MAG: diguanylate cyclase [Anaerolineales bacterium]